MQVYNPYLPLNEYVPDGEPHIFGDRLYVFGSHDKAQGTTYCMQDYVVYSAPLDNLADWSMKGISYSGWDDPLAKDYRHDLYAPDVVRGNDGKYYLYYCLAGENGKYGYDGPIGVAVCDTPDGRYQFYGHVRYSDGRIFDRFVAFDPAVINDDGVIRLYYGTGYPIERMLKTMNRQEFLAFEAEIFHKSIEEIAGEPDGVMGAIACELEDDMLTVKGEPVKIIPEWTDGTSFEGHGFFEASSIRKIGDVYYFVYSSQNFHELCYATSIYPDRDFVYRGVLVSNGDIGYEGRKTEDCLSIVGNNHGGMVALDGQWYIFYHRHTNLTSFSRQGCAEAIEILPDGSIPQVEMTSCGLNGKPLEGSGIYPAAICCNLTNFQMFPKRDGSPNSDIPYITGDETQTFVKNISDKTVIGYKYFVFHGPTKICVKVRGDSGVFEVRTTIDGEVLGRVEMKAAEEWQEFAEVVSLPEDVAGLFFTYRGSSKIEFIEFTLVCES